MSSSDLPPGVPPYVKVFGPGANCTLDICPAEMSVYGYRPSLPSNITFLALYLISAVIHIYLGYRWKTWFFTTCMVVGAFNAALGYAGRIAMYYNPFNFAAFMIQIICITSGPVYYAAAIYVTLASAINYFAPELSRFRPKLFYWIFIPADMVCLIFQAVGGALATSSAGTSQIGTDMALVGLSLQVVVMVGFCCCFGDYLFRYFRSGSTEKFGRRCTLFFSFMASAVVLILVRCAYRVAELKDGYRGDLIGDEALFIVLEGVMVIVAVFCLMIGHPGFGFAAGDKASSSTVGGQSHELQRLRSTSGTNASQTFPQRS